MPDDFDEVDSPWVALDAKLQVALKHIIKGDLLVRVGNAMDVKTRQNDILSVRATLCMIAKEFEPNGRNYATDAIDDVYRLKCHPSLPGLEAYMSGLDKLLLRCTEEQP
eukprot:544269-Heterocapsa_arctica.AAC.1